MLLKDSKRSPIAERPFPWRCNHCGKDSVNLTTLSYDAEVKHDEYLHTFNIPQLEIPVCKPCGQKVFTVRVDEQIKAALRSHVGLLTPEEIQNALDCANLTPKDAATRLGVSEDTLSRWLDKCQIQSRAMDNLLRFFFRLPGVCAVEGESQNSSAGESNGYSEKRERHIEI